MLPDKAVHYPLATRRRAAFTYAFAHAMMVLGNKVRERASTRKLAAFD